MSLTYRALGLLLGYPSTQLQALTPEITAVIDGDRRLPSPLKTALTKLAAHLAEGDLYDLQEDYVQLFDRSRTLSLNLYEHVHGESRDRGAAMAALVELYRQQGLELSARELPDYLPVFLDFLSTLEEPRAASLLGEAAHVLEALGERLHKRASPYRAVFGALTVLADQVADPALVAAMTGEPDEDPDDLEALDRAWEETAVTFGPSTDDGCPKAEAMLKSLNGQTGSTPPRGRAA